jgi:glycosyltransferase involved in cell wall biosynthesis
MKLLVDGISLERNDLCGIRNMFRAMLPQISRINTDLKISVYNISPCNSLVELNPSSNLVQHKLFAWYKYLRPGRIFYPFINRSNYVGLVVGKGDRESIWLSTYYTLPNKSFIGKRIVVVYDMIHEIYRTTWFRGSDDFIKTKLNNLVEADSIITISDKTKQDILRFYPYLSVKPIVPIHLAHAPIFQWKNISKTTEPFILFVGSRGLYKNFDFFVKSYASWAHRDSIPLKVVGSPWKDDEIKLLNRLNIYQLVENLEFVSDEALCNLYNQASAFVFPSLYEGFGIPICEALACGCRVLASDIPVFREVGSDFLTYFDPYSVDSIHNALDQVYLPYSHQQIDTQLNFVARYTWEETAKLWNHVLTA